MGNKHSFSGFTLVEVLVATLITAILMVAVLGTLWSGVSGRDEIHNLSEEQTAGNAILGTIERDLQGLFVYNIAGKKVFQGINKSIQGEEADFLDFITTTDSKFPLIKDERKLRSDLCEVGYRLRPNPEKPDFLQIWRRESFFLDDKPFEGGTFSLLYDQVKYFNVSYYAEPGNQAEEQQEWSSEKNGTLPYSMKIELEIESRPRFERGESTGPQKRSVKFLHTFLFPKELNQTLKLAVIPFIPEKEPQVQAAAQTGQGNQAGQNNQTPNNNSNRR